MHPGRVLLCAGAFTKHGTRPIRGDFPCSKIRPSRAVDGKVEDICVGLNDFAVGGRCASRGCGCHGCRFCGCLRWRACAVSSGVWLVWCGGAPDRVLVLKLDRIFVQLFQFVSTPMAACEKHPGVFRCLGWVSQVQRSETGRGRWHSFGIAHRLGSGIAQAARLGARARMQGGWEDTDLCSSKSFVRGVPVSPAPYASLRALLPNPFWVRTSRSTADVHSA